MVFSRFCKVMLWAQKIPSLLCPTMYNLCQFQLCHEFPHLGGGKIIFGETTVPLPIMQESAASTSRVHAWFSLIQPLWPCWPEICTLSQVKCGSDPHVSSLKPQSFYTHLLLYCQRNETNGSLVSFRDAGRQIFNFFLTFGQSWDTCFQQLW